ncbi:hypothetical protein ACN20G_32895 (plasmid) [Streptomyces sp. BI20]|uniref:hypothetical protein n=1 Tax=Streptomyces sp. BI20 TaxID=3403460 RepID=UPI003C75E225
MVVALIIACEVGFWVLLALGLGLRYVARMPRLGAAVLLLEPLLELTLLVVSVIDLRGGAEPSWRHGLAAAYIGYTVAYGKYTIDWLDGHAAYRFGGGPKPPGSSYGRERAVHEWKLWGRTLIAAVVAWGLLQGAVWFVGDAGDTTALRSWQYGVWRVAGIHAVIALTYTIWPKRPKRDADDGAPAGDGEERWDGVAYGRRARRKAEAEVFGEGTSRHHGERDRGERDRADRW